MSTDGRLSLLSDHSRFNVQRQPLIITRRLITVSVADIYVMVGGIKDKRQNLRFTTPLHPIQPADYSRQVMRQHDLSTEV